MRNRTRNIWCIQFETKKLCGFTLLCWEIVPAAVLRGCLSESFHCCAKILSVWIILLLCHISSRMLWQNQLPFSTSIVYRMKFNDIQKINCNSRCNLKDQRHKWICRLVMNTGKGYGRLHKTNDDFITFCDKTHCSIVDNDVKTIPASSTTAGRIYHLICVPTVQSLCLPVNQLLILVTCNVDFFASGLMPVCTVNQRMIVR